MDSNLSCSSVSQTFEKALEAHSSNKLKDAQSLYEDILKIDPQHPEANHNFGLIRVTQNEYARALELFKVALNTQPNVSLFWASYIDTLIKLDRITEAKTITQAVKESGLFCEKIQSLHKVLSSTYQEPTRNHTEELDKLLEKCLFEEAIENCFNLIKPYPNSAIICLVLGDAYRELGEIDQATTYYKKVCEYQPDWPEGFVRLGELNTRRNNIEAAKDYFQKAIKRDGQDHHTFYKLGVLLVDQDKDDEAIKCFKKAIQLEPNYADSHNAIGLIFLNKNEKKKAEESFKKAILIDPNHASANCNLGVVLLSNQKVALKYYERALEINPNHTVSLANSGMLLNAMGYSKKAKINLRRAIDLDPNYAVAHYNLGVTYSENNEPCAALSSFKETLKQDPQNNNAQVSLAIEMLKSQNFKDGWLNHEARWNADSCDSPSLTTSKPRWDPTRKDERVLLWTEQGLGDVIMFSSIIPDLLKLVGKLIIKVDERLIPLFRRSFSDDIRFYPQNRTIFEAEYDSHIPIASLPLYFRSSLESFKKASGTYLKHNSNLTDDLRNKLTDGDNRLIYGISWRGGSHQNNANRKKEINLEKFVEIFDGKKAQLINLQYGDTAEELNLLAKNCGVDVISVKEIDNFKDIDGLASLISACDGVISADNSTVFLAGALGKETSVLLPFANDWRWGRNQDQSYWHSSLNLYKQSQRGDWSDPIKHLKIDLDEK